MCQRGENVVRRPNVLVLMCDQMRADALGCNGNPVIRTPNLDYLARTGVNFPMAYTPNPICVPARACMTTGSYPHKCTGVKSNSGTILPGFPLMGEEFSRRGYATYGMGKLHFLPYLGPGERTTYGIEVTEITESGRLVSQYNGAAELEDYIDYLKTVGWEGYSRGSGLGNNDIFATASPLPKEHYVDGWVTDRSIFYLKKHLDERPEQPFFMFTSYPKPHSPYDPPRPYDIMYDPRDMPRPAGGIEDIRSRGLDLFYERHFAYDWCTLSDAAKQVIKAHYYGLISYQDEQIGRILTFLRSKGILDEEWPRSYTYDRIEVWKRRSAPSAAKKQSMSSEDSHRAGVKSTKAKAAGKRIRLSRRRTDTAKKRKRRR